jgi:hypothetical protein
MTPENDEARTRAILQHVLSLWAGFSHELVFPLSAISNMTELLLEKELDDDTRDWLAIGQSGVERIALLSCDIRDALLCYKEPYEEERPVLIQPLLADVVANVEFWYQQHNIGFEHRVANELPTYILVKEWLVRTALGCLLKTCAAHFADTSNTYSWPSCVDFEVGVRDGSVIFKAMASGNASRQGWGWLQHVWPRPDMGLAELVRKLGSQLHEDRAESGWTLWFELGGDVLSGDEPMSATASNSST